MAKRKKTPKFVDLYGIVVAEDADESGEVFDVAGCDCNDLKDCFVYSSLDGGAHNLVGHVLDVRKVCGPGSSVGRDRELFAEVRVPFVVADVQIAEALLPWWRDAYFAATGTCLERSGNRLTRTRLTALAFTTRPAHKLYRVRAR